MMTLDGNDRCFGNDGQCSWVAQKGEKKDQNERRKKKQEEEVLNKGTEEENEEDNYAILYPNLKSPEN